MSIQNLKTCRQEQTPDSPFTGIMPVYKYEDDKLLSDFPNANRMFTTSTRYA